MSLIDRAATFRGDIVDHGVSLTKNDWPQWIAQLRAIEIWDEEEQIWVDWSDVDQCEITAYMVLLGKNGETLTANQMKKAVKWNGESYSGLSNMDLSGIPVQFRVEENTYQEKTTLQVNWIDEYDATPGRSVRKLDPEELKGIDAKYKRYLSGAKKATPVSKPKTKPKPPPVKAEGSEPTQSAGPVAKKRGRPKKGGADPLAAEAPPMPEMPKDATPGPAVGSCTKKEAYDYVCAETHDQRNSNPPKIDDKQFGEAWVTAVQKFSNNPDDLTNEQWYQVRVDTLDTLVGIPF